MNDPIIRNIVKTTELSQYSNDNNSIIVDELKLPVAKARVDIAVINGHLHAYEIKSAKDTLIRLPQQIDAYSKVFDYITVVTEQKHYAKVLALLPDWVGLALCSFDELKPIYNLSKPPTFNENKDGFHIAKLLWNNELIEILKEHEVPHTKPFRNWLMCETLSKYFEVNELSNIVRNKLKKRKEWKVKEDYIVK